MIYKKLGKTSLDVSLICLGTMTWGQQNSKIEAFEQMDYAFKRGINFFDTSEYYSIPPNKKTSGATESIIGEWFESRKCRKKIILATKVIGRSNMMWFRGKETRLNREQITKALENSLKRLRTDYIDLYQLHWPDRKVNNFGQLGYKFSEDEDFIELKDQLETLDDLVRQGMIRHIGLSNETPWGVMKFLELSEQFGLQRIVSIQNPYSLLNRSYEVGLAEISIRENCGLLAYSPLGFGMLTGKYDNGKKPNGSRLTLYGERYTRYTKNKGIEESLNYNLIAKKYGLSPAQMALAFVNTRCFVTSTIIGATNMKQLKENIDSVDIKLNKDLLELIDQRNAQVPYPSP